MSVRRGEEGGAQEAPLEEAALARGLGWSQKLVGWVPGGVVAWAKAGRPKLQSIRALLGDAGNPRPDADARPRRSSPQAALALEFS